MCLGPFERWSVLVAGGVAIRFVLGVAIGMGMGKSSVFLGLGLLVTFLSVTARLSVVDIVSCVVTLLPIYNAWIAVHTLMDLWRLSASSIIALNMLPGITLFAFCRESIVLGTPAHTLDDAFLLFRRGVIGDVGVVEMVEDGMCVMMKL